jgi:capsular polysaccharide transport system permease protein
MSQSLNAISGNRGLLFYPDIRPLDLVLARTLLEAATYILVFAILMAGEAMWADRAAIHSLPMTVLGMMLASGLGFGLGLVLCGLSAFFPTLERLIGPATRPLFWISGLFFSVNELPSEAQALLLHNPLLHVIELTRSGWFAGYDVPRVSVWYPALWIVVLSYFGLTLERAARRHVEVA